MKVLFDANIYFAILADPAFLPAHRDLLQRLAPSTWLSSVVLRTKRLLNDVLIACCARRVGAVVVTENVKDFRIIGKRLRHTACALADLEG